MIHVCTQEERQQLLLEERRQKELNSPKTEPPEPETPQRPEAEQNEQPNTSSPPNTPEVRMKWQPEGSIKGPEKHIFSVTFLHWAMDR